MSSNEEIPPKQPPANGLVARAVRLSDAEEITELMNLPGYRAGTLRPPHQSVEDVRKRMESAPPGFFGLVVTLDGKIVANGSTSRFSGRRQHAANLGMGVHDNYVGRGIGAFLLSELIDAANNWQDIRRLELTVYTDNEAAIALYQKFGFEEEGLLKAFAFRAGLYVNAYAMARVRP